VQQVQVVQKILGLMELLILAVAVVVLMQVRQAIEQLAVQELLFFPTQLHMDLLHQQQVRHRKHHQVVITFTPLQEAGASLSNGTLCST
jgi:hypothetical protein